MFINEVQAAIDKGGLELPDDDWKELNKKLDFVCKFIERDYTNQSDLEGAALWVITAFSENHTLSEMFSPRIIFSKKLQKQVNKSSYKAYHSLTRSYRWNLIIGMLTRYLIIMGGAIGATVEPTVEPIVSSPKYSVIKKIKTIEYKIKEKYNKKYAKSAQSYNEVSNVYEELVNLLKWNEQTGVVPPESEDRSSTQTEAFAIARLEDVEDDEPLLLSAEYKLLAGVSHEEPSGFRAQKFQLPAVEEVEMDVVIHAPGFNVSPNWSQCLKVIQGEESELLEFMLIPKEAGENKIEVKFYYGTRWLTAIEFKVIVITPESLKKLMSKQRHVMSVPKKVLIPPLAYRTDEIDIGLDISLNNGHRYDLTIRTKGQKLAPVTIKGSRDEWASLSSDLQQEMAKVVRKICKSTEPLRDDECARLLRPLARLGHLVFNRLFAGEGVAELINNQRAPQDRPLAIEIGSTDFFLPWECLYPKKLNEPLSVESFWGMRHTIFRQITRSKAADLVNPEIKTPCAPTIGLLSYHKLRGVQEKEVPFFEKLDAQKRITRLKLRALDPMNKHSELEELSAFWRHPLHVSQNVHAANLRLAKR